MTFRSNLADLTHKDLAAYGVQRARDAAFDAVRELWIRRKAEGLMQKDLADRIGRDRGWVSTCLRGPGNWTMRTLGELAAGLGGEIEIKVAALEDAAPGDGNYGAYDDYDPDDFTPAGSSYTPVKLEKPVKFTHAR